MNVSWWFYCVRIYTKPTFVASITTWKQRKNVAVSAHIIVMHGWAVKTWGSIRRERLCRNQPGYKWLWSVMRSTYTLWALLMMCFFFSYFLLPLAMEWRYVLDWCDLTVVCCMIRIQKCQTYKCRGKDHFPSQVQSNQLILSLVKHRDIC